MNDAETREMEEALKNDQEKRDMKKIVDKLFHEINNFSYQKNSDNFFEAMQKQHRTLQQSFWRLIFDVVKKYAELDKEGWYDLRNEASVKACVKLKVWLENNYPALPTI